MRLDYLDDYLVATMREVAAGREKFIELHLKPRPKWLPRFLYLKIIQRLLVLKEIYARN